jgi:hypothetical protein
MVGSRISLESKLLLLLLQLLPGRIETMGWVDGICCTECMSKCLVTPLLDCCCCCCQVGVRPWAGLVAYAVQSA